MNPNEIPVFLFLVGILLLAGCLAPPETAGQPATVSSDSAVRGLAFSPVGRVLATASEDSEFLLWGVAP